MKQPTPKFSFLDTPAKKQKAFILKQLRQTYLAYYINLEKRKHDFPNVLPENTWDVYMHYIEDQVKKAYGKVKGNEMIHKLMNSYHLEAARKVVKLKKKPWLAESKVSAKKEKSPYIDWLKYDAKGNVRKSYLRDEAAKNTAYKGRRMNLKSLGPMGRKLREARIEQEWEDAYKRALGSQIRSVPMETDGTVVPLTDTQLIRAAEDYELMEAADRVEKRLANNLMTPGQSKAARLGLDVSSPQGQGLTLEDLQTREDLMDDDL